MSTAGPAWGDTARTQEAPVLLEGAGLANVLAADDPKIFTDPQSLSFQRIDVSPGAQRKSMLLTVSDAGGGAGNWTVSLAPQSQTSGVQIDVPGPSRSRPAATWRFPSSCAPRPTPGPARTTASSSSPGTACSAASPTPSSSSAPRCATRRSSR